MNILLVFCKLDIASLNFYNSLKNNYKINNGVLDITGKNKIFILEIDKMHIFLEKDYLSFVISNYSDIDLVVFMSKHSTLGNIKPRTISVHAIGNWGKAELGGNNETLVKTDPILIRCLLLKFYKNEPKTLEFEIKQEATHHGPYLEKPTIFIEIGSCKNSWKNQIVSNFVLDNTINILKDYNKKETKERNKWREAIGVGGSHYCTKFNRLTFDDSNLFCFGHIIPDYALKQITDKQKLKELLEQAKKKSKALLIINNNLEII